MLNSNQMQKRDKYQSNNLKKDIEAKTIDFSPH